MAAFENVQRETLAQALARGLSPAEASREAAYKSVYRGRARGRAERPDMVARIEEIHWENARSAGDIGPIIQKLTDAADKASALNNAAGYAATRGLLAEAARLKLLTAPAATPPRPPRAFAKPLTPAQWLAKYGPDATSAP